MPIKPMNAIGEGQSTSFRCPHVRRSDPELEDLILQLEYFDALNHYSKALTVELYRSTLDLIHGSFEVVYQLQILFSKNLGEETRNPVTKTLEEEFVQGYYYTLGDIANKAMPILESTFKKSEQKCAKLDKIIASVKFKAVKHDMYSQYFEGCKVCSRRDSNHLRGISRIKRKDSEMLKKYGRLKAFLKEELPLFNQYYEDFTTKLLALQASAQEEIANIVIKDLAGFYKVWNIDIDDGIPMNEEDSSNTSRNKVCE